MLNIWFSLDGSQQFADNYVFNTDTWFDNRDGEKYITGDVERKMIKDIDNSDVISEHLVENPVVGAIPPSAISCSVKTLILIKNQPQYIFNGSAMGNKCATWLLEIAKNQDITIRLGYLMDFPAQCDIHIINSDRTVHTYNDYLLEAAKVWGGLL